MKNDDNGMVMKLIPFPGTIDHCPFRIEADLSWRDSTFRADFAVIGPPETLGLQPSGKAGERAERLWEDTCFEVFLRPVESDFYWEINLSPDGRWNFWRLEGYRTGLAAEKRVTGPTQWSCELLEGRWRMAVTFDLRAIPELACRPIRATVAAVAAPAQGEKTFWSLVHSQDKPDFHYPDHFVLLYENVGWK